MAQQQQAQVLTMKSRQSNPALIKARMASMGALKVVAELKATLQSVFCTAW